MALKHFGKASGVGALEQTGGVTSVTMMGRDASLVMTLARQAGNEQKKKAAPATPANK